MSCGGIQIEPECGVFVQIPCGVVPEIPAPGSHAVDRRPSDGTDAARVRRNPIWPDRTAIRSSTSIGWCGASRSDIACASVGISGVANTPANTLDEQLVRQHRGWRSACSDQAIYRKSEARLMRATTSFVAGFPLCTTAADEAALPIRLPFRSGWMPNATSTTSAWANAFAGST
jgi:hypothetical protein